MIKFVTHNLQTKIAIHILPNISRKKGDQSLKYNMRNIFLKKLYARCGGKTILIPFSKESKLSIFLDNSLKLYTVRFYCMSG